MLEEVGRAPLLALPPAVPEGLELLLVLLGVPEPELLEPPGLPELLDGAGGAKEGEVKISYVNHQMNDVKTHFQGA